MNDQPRVWLVRHGETVWSRDGRHTSRTDIDLTTAGEDQARALATVFSQLEVDRVLCSPRLRAQRTAKLAGLTPYEVTDDLQEWDYGDLEGRTTSDIRKTWPGWSIWGGPWPGGETADDVAVRADRLLKRVRESGDSAVVLVGHGHFSRVTGARWIGEEVSAGRWLDLDTATWSELGWSRDDAVIRHWNVPATETSR
jgi:broad specificity phosphatase PhoE